MQPTFNQMIHFCTLAETGNMGRAAEKLNMSQPPLSRQIAQLENTLGVKLFERSAKGVSLTLAGEQFLQNAREIINLTQQASRNAQAIATGKRGSLKLGSSMYASYSVVPHIAKRHRIEQPEVKLILQELPPTELTRSLLEGSLDAAISFIDVETPGLNSMVLLQEALVAALPVYHPCAHEAQLPLSKLAPYDFITISRNMSPLYYDNIIAQCRKAGFSPTIGLEVSVQQTIVNFVAHGFGVALVPASMQHAPVNGVIYKPLTETVSIKNVLAWSTRNKNACLESFLTICRTFSQAHNT